MEETGVTNVADPLGGAWYIEELTDRIEEQAEAIFRRILDLGGNNHDHPIGPITAGLLRGVDDGWFSAEIADSAFTYQIALEKGEKKQVGVTVHVDRDDDELEILRISHEVERAQKATLEQRKRDRDGNRVQQALDAMRATARGSDNLVPPMLDAVRAEATLGEICGVLREEFGEYREPARV
jgi:methylmalonyl-CoA mutase N-terminal domain/subunit